MRIHYLQHEEFEGLGCIEDWIIKNKITYSGTKLYLGEKLPAPDDIDWLIIMGGTASVYEEDKYPYLKAEKEYIRRCIQSDKIVLGICLGAQLIAEVMGARVYPGKFTEIGWFHIRFNHVLREHLIPELPCSFKVFHWHGDTFEIPSGTRLIGYSEATPHQGFVLENRVVALQFHFEIMEEGLKSMIHGTGGKIKREQFVQPVKELLMNKDYFIENNVYMHQMLDNLYKIKQESDKAGNFIQ